jgi:C4-dicarboxylate-binding protein DctP
MDLPDDLRDELRAVLDESISYGNQVAADQAMADRQKIIDSKRTEVIPLTAEERALWVEAMKPVWKQFEGEIGKTLIDAALGANQSRMAAMQ